MTEHTDQTEHTDHTEHTRPRWPPAVVRAFQAYDDATGIPPAVGDFRLRPSARACGRHTLAVWRAAAATIVLATVAAGAFAIGHSKPPSPVALTASPVPSVPPGSVRTEVQCATAGPFTTIVRTIAEETCSAIFLTNDQLKGFTAYVDSRNVTDGNPSASCLGRILSLGDVIHLIGDLKIVPDSEDFRKPCPTHFTDDELRTLVSILTR